MSEETFNPASAGLSLLEKAPDAMVVTDPDGRIVLVNAQAERLFGYERSELLGCSVEMLVPPRLRGNHTGQRESYQHAPKVRPMGAGLDLYGMRKDGYEFPVEISLSPIKIRGETYVSSAIRDITARKKIEEVLHQKNLVLRNASLAKDRFLAGMSHELRTPLNAIIGFTGTLLMELPGPLTADQQKQLRIIESSANHLLSLINDILDVARIESGKVSLNIEPVAVAAVARNAADSLRAMAAEKHLRYELVLPADDLTVQSDYRALLQILLNLVNNAIKYTERGSVTMLVRERNAHIEFRVVDTGIGIREEDRVRLFQAFEQLDASNTRRFQGVGLGLHLSRRLSTLIGGALECESVYGKGSTFTVSIPKAGAAPP